MFAGMMARPRATSERTNSARQAFAGGDELHLGSDLVAAGVVQLRADDTRRPPRGDPRLAQLRQSGAHVVTLRTAGVVQANRRLLRRSARPRASARAAVICRSARSERRGALVICFREFGYAAAKSIMGLSMAWGGGDRVRIAALPPPVLTGSGSKGLSQSSSDTPGGLRDYTSLSAPTRDPYNSRMVIALLLSLLMAQATTPAKPAPPQPQPTLLRKQHPRSLERPTARQPASTRSLEWRSPHRWQGIRSGRRDRRTDGRRLAINTPAERRTPPDRSVFQDFAQVRIISASRATR